MTDFVLVHGAFHGGWCWEAVAALLTAKGHRVYAPTLAGCAERSSESHGVITLRTHVDAIVDIIEADDLHDVVLVGHSLGGMVVTAVADRVLDRISSLVYIDAFVPESGQAARDLIPAAMHSAALSAVHLKGGGVSLPVIFPAAKFVQFAEDAANDFLSRLTSQPFMTFSEPIYLQHAPVARRTYVYCSAVPFGLFDGYAAAAQADPSWTFHDLPTAHDAMIEAPEALTSILTAARNHVAIDQHH